MEGSLSSCSLVILNLLVVLAFVNIPLEAKARAFFVFGDPLVDNGNNDFLVTTARADFPPYGIDYPTHRPTGEHMGMESPLPYLSPLLTGNKLLNGANFASAGVGILNDTGVQFLDYIIIKYSSNKHVYVSQLNIIRIWKQLEYLEQYQARLVDIIGPDQTRQVVNEGMVLISLSGNDFVNNYYLVPFSARSRQYSLPDYVCYVVSEYRNILSKMYDVGARRVLVMGTGPMGCVPAELAQHSRAGECSVELQRASDLFNPQLNDMLKSLNNEKGDQVFVAANTMRMHMDYISNPEAYGTKYSSLFKNLH
ncbi:GDSL esterase/lipase At5g33370-like [Bidens hawaiensis]|uniref:GDSL esterase/lipase At5g33370-like n=1 Tax=Bidens hawaiensis TaxID=980011 RepID=UPI00404AC07E